MAQKKTEFEIDDFDLDAALDFNIDGFSSEKVKDDRTPVKRIKDAIYKGAKESVVNPNTYKELIKRSLPREYGEVYEDLDQASQKLGSAYQAAVNEVKPSLSRFAQSAKAYVPESLKPLRDLLKKVEDWGKEQKAFTQSKEEQRQDNLNLELSKIFSAQFEQGLKSRAEDQAKQKLDDALGVMRHRSKMSILTQVNTDLKRLSDYTTTITQAYQKKSLELQFRSYQVQADLLELQRKQTVALMARLDAIAKNTALPEYAKITKTERFKDILKNDFARGATESLFGNTRQKANKLVENLIANIRGLSKSSIEALELGAMGTDLMAGEDSLMGPNAPKFYEAAARAKGKSLIESLANKLGLTINRSIKRKAPKLSRKLYQGANNLNYLRNNLFGVIKDWSSDTGHYWRDEGSFMGRNAKYAAQNLVRLFLPRGAEDQYLKFDKQDQLLTPTIFNNQTAKSINEVIPGLLARILREINVLRTGNESASLLTYDYNKSKFLTDSQATKAIQNELVSESNQQSFAERFNYNLKNAEIGDQLSPVEKRVLARAMVVAKSKGESFSEKFFTDASNFGLNGKQISKVFSDYYNPLGEDGKLDEVTKAQRRATMAEIGDNIDSYLTSPAWALQNQVNLGRREKLLEMGLIDERGNINYQAFADILTNKLLPEKKKRIIHSDRNLKESIKSFSPHKALEGIRNLKVKLWSYKKGSVADDGSQTHIGPMAQDVNSQLGEDTAPNRDRIDLGNLTSANISATQALDSKVSHLTNNLKDYLTSFTNIFTSKKDSKTIADRIANIEDLLILQTAKTDQGTYTNLGQALKSPNSSITTQDASRWKKLLTRFSLIKPQIKALPTLGSAITHAGAAAGSLAKLGVMAIPHFLNHALTVANLGIKAGTLTAGAGIWAGSKLLKGLGSSLTEGLTGFSFKKQTQEDLYLPGSNEPVILASKLKLGKYIDSLTGKVIKSVKDIKGAVIDTQTNSTVVNSADIDKLFSYDKVKQKAVSAGLSIPKQIPGLIEGVSSIFGGAAARSISRLKSIASFASRAFKNEAFDVYSPSSQEPKLTKSGFDNHLYYTKEGSLITHPSEVKDEVYDENGNKLITRADIQSGLTDVNGKPISKGSGIASRLTTGLAATAAAPFMAAGATIQVLNKAFRGITRFSTQSLKSMLGSFDSAAASSLMQSEQLKVSIGIKDILDQRLPGKKASFTDKDADGDRDNSWQDILSRKKDKDPESKETKDSDNGPKPIDYGKNESLLDKLKDSLMDKVGGWVGSILSGALGAIGLGGLFGGKNKAPKVPGPKDLKKGGFLSKLFGGLKSAGGSIGKGGLSALSGLATGLGTTGAGLGAAGAALSSKQGLLAKLGGSFLKANSGILTTAGSLGASAAKAAPGIAKGIGSVAGAAGRALGALPSLGSMLGGKILPGIGTLMSGYSLYSNLKEGNYGSAALDAGLLSLSTLGLGGTISAIGSVAGTALAGLGAALSSPAVLVGLGAAAVGYGGYKLYKWITKKRFKPIDILRMYQYGVGDKDKEQQMQIYNLEKLLQPYVSISGDTAQLNASKVDPKEILKIFDINPDDQANTARLNIWFEKRFKPVYLASMTAIYRTKGKLDIDEISKLSKADEELKFLDLATKDSSCYAITTLPFVKYPNTPFTINYVVERISEYKAALLKQIPESQKQLLSQTKEATNPDKKDDKTNPEVLKTQEANKNQKLDQKLQTVANINSNENKLSNQRVIEASLSNTVQVQARQYDDFYNTRQVKAFDAVRYKAYGLTKLEKSKIQSLKWLENYCIKELKEGPDQTLIWQGDTLKAITLARSYFGVNPKDEEQSKAWMNWFTIRFLPVFTTTLSLIQKDMGSSNVQRAFSVYDQYRYSAVQICNKLIAFDTAWRCTDSPWPDEKIGTDPAIAKDNITFLKEKIADIEALEQTKKKEENKSKPDFTQGYQKTSYTPQTPSSPEPYSTTTSNNTSGSSSASVNTTPVSYTPARQDTSPASQAGVEPLTLTPGNNNHLAIAGLSGDAVKALLDQIAKGEGTTLEKAKRYDFDSEYDVTLGYGQRGLPRPPKPLTQMTLGEVKQYQAKLGQAWARGPGRGTYSSAVGKYQIVGQTLRGLQKRLDKDDSALFTPELQDQFALELLKSRGIEKWAKGKMTDQQFHSSLASEWDSIADPNKQGDLTRAHSKTAGTTKTQVARIFTLMRGTPASTTTTLVATNEAPKDFSNKPIGNSGYKPDAKTRQLYADTPSSNDEGEKPSAGAGSSYSSSIESNRKDNDNYKAPLASGEVASGSGASAFLKLSNSRVKMAQLHPTFHKLFLGAVEEYGRKTGKKVQVNSAFRSFDEQMQLYQKAKREGKPKAAYPGNSMHEFGLAIDANRDPMNEMEKLGILRKYGLTRPIATEPWHVEPVGVQLNTQAAKQAMRTDPNSITSLIESGIGRGGGGAGATGGSKSRNLAYYKQALAATPSASDVVDMKSLNETNVPTAKIELPASKPVDNSAMTATSTATPIASKPAPITTAAITQASPSFNDEGERYSSISSTTATAPRVQPETIQSNTRINEQIRSAQSLLKDQLDVQRQILTVLKQMHESKQSAPAAPSYVKDITPRQVKPAVISMAAPAV